MESDKIVNYIKIALTIGQQIGCKIYIVGGYVRDKILKLKSVDLDFVVEGSGWAAAESLHKKFGGKLTVYRKFLTASLKLKSGFVIDIATSRTETYSRPASMPTVTPAKIKKDLFRRDFTINALAIPLPSTLYPLPSIIDVCGGLDDIKNKLIRVLHKKSFSDDPTRILRAIRYAIRFNFKIEKNTEKWMNAAIKKNLLSLVSKPRIRDEFIKVLSEKNAKKILTEFKKRKILKHIDDKLALSAISEKKESVKARLEKLIKNFTDDQKKSFLQKLCLPAKIS
ncbi:MAG: hypothetical protein Q7K21_07825 [Elusimicrobiota bacterium]|nr:hypothetical protein [Elusimicrobiota bacterium]